MLQKGGWSFYCFVMFRGLSWLKISNIGTAWTCRIYIRMLIAYNMRAISMEDAFVAFLHIGSVFRTRWYIVSSWQKYAFKACYFVKRKGGALILISLRTFLFLTLHHPFGILFFFHSLFVCFSFLFFLFFRLCVFLTCLLAYLLIAI